MIPIDIDVYRSTQAHWQNLAYLCGNSDERGDYDTQEKQRYAAMLAIQYDFKETDEALVRFLVEQETVARRNDSFQGIGDALWLGAYLLARFKRPEDIPLFYQAKVANFDTYCGFDREFMYIALYDETTAYVQQNFPDLLDEIKDDFATTEDLEQWWKNLAQRFPDNEEKESLDTLFHRYIYFDDKEKAKYYLEKRIELSSEEEIPFLESDYIALEEYGEALRIIQEKLETPLAEWERRMHLKSALELCTKLKDKQLGFKMIQTVDEVLQQSQDYKQSWDVAHKACDYLIEMLSQSLDIKQLREAFNTVNSWFSKSNKPPYVALVARYETAKALGFKLLTMRYRYDAKREKKRIDKILL